MLQEAGDDFDLEKVERGDQTPVFFGSALTNFGVQTFLEHFLEYAPKPHAHKTKEEEKVDPYEEEFSGFVFKIQVQYESCSPRPYCLFTYLFRDFYSWNGCDLRANRQESKIKQCYPIYTDARENIQEAVAGDIIGIYDTGTYQVGDTLYEGKLKVAYEDLPVFTPELFMQVNAKNVMKQKSFYKGIRQLVQEGAIQMYQTYMTDDFIIGAVGQLQFEVFQYRMKNEYNSEVIMKPLGHKIARWIDPKDLDEKMHSSRNILAKDRFGKPLILF